jgi:hypothetical protein
VTLSRPLGRPLTVCAAAAPGTAWPVLDFNGYAGCTVLPAGRTTTSFTVTVRGDRRPEPDESLRLVIGGLADIRVNDGVATGTIENDD